MPKTHSTPWASRVSTKAWAPVIVPLTHPGAGRRPRASALTAGKAHNDWAAVNLSKSRRHMSGFMPFSARGDWPLVRHIVHHRNKRWVDLMGKVERELKLVSLSRLGNYQFGQPKGLQLRDD